MPRKSKGLFKTSKKDPGPDKRKKQRGLFKTTAQRRKEMDKRQAKK